MVDEVGGLLNDALEVAAELVVLGSNDHLGRLFHDLSGDCISSTVDKRRRVGAFGALHQTLPDRVPQTCDSAWRLRTETGVFADVACWAARCCGHQQRIAVTVGAD